MQGVRVSDVVTMRCLSWSLALYKVIQWTFYYVVIWYARGMALLCVHYALSVTNGVVYCMYGILTVGFCAFYVYLLYFIVHLSLCCCNNVTGFNVMLCYCHSAHLFTVQEDGWKLASCWIWFPIFLFLANKKQINVIIKMFNSTRSVRLLRPTSGQLFNCNEKNI